MPAIDHFLEPRITVLDKNPEWCECWADEDFDLDIIPTDLPFDGMDYQARGFHGAFPVDRRISREPQSPDSQRRFIHSPINGPTAWSASFPGPSGHYNSSQPPYYEQYPRPSPPGIRTPDNGRQLRSWHGGTTEIDACSTISPLSPKTPVAKSDVDCNVASSPWTIPPSSMTHHFDIKQEPANLREGGSGVSMEQIHPDGRNTPIVLRGVQGPPGTGHAQYPPGQFQAELSHPAAADGFHYNSGYVSPKEVGPSHEQTMTDEIDDYDDAMEDAPGDDVSEYTPSHQAVPAKHTKPPQGRGSRKQNKGFLKPQNQDNRVQKQSQTTDQQLVGVSSQFASLPSNGTLSSNNCPHCHNHFQSTATLQKHIQNKHTRPFTCIFRRYSCPQTFGSKNEWARHIRVQHLRLEGWRCDVGKCGNGEPDARHSFDRKDLFTQHLRRMHKELSTKAALAPFEGNRARMETETQDRCHVKLRDPPAGAVCPYCPEDAESAADDNEDSPPAGAERTETWEAFLEHVARHLEKGISADEHNGREDEELKQWLLDHGLLRDNNNTWGSFKIVGAEGKKSNNAGSASAVRSPVPILAGHASGRRQRRSRRNAAVHDDDLDAPGEDVE